MSVVPFAVPLWVELLAAGLGGLQGALVAAEHRHQRIDVLGVLVIGLLVALGGSLLRDVVLNEPPVVIWQNWYLLVAAAGAVVGMAVASVIARAVWPLIVLDAIVMGMFGAIGASKALSLGVGPVGAVVVGVIGAIGGGMLRDVALNLPFSFLQVSTLYAVAAASGVAVLVVLNAFAVPTLIAGVICIAVTVTVRVVAVAFRWTFPEPGLLRRPRAT
ncbi:TRIC cation channel family protein [Microbacterium sp. MM2322]|uniref:trimeric intracellular cation channel family protein n=1 Tax=Microbacterium sp. MM2322 TaxID=3157631 RepID=UPI0032D5A463